MSIETHCPKGHPVRVAEEHVGLKLRCPTCGDLFIVQSKPTGRQPVFADSPPAAATPAPESLASGVPMAGANLFGTPVQNATGGAIAAASGAAIAAGRVFAAALPGSDVFHAGRRWGQPLVLVGLLLVAGARGCTRLGTAGIERATNLANVARLEWQQGWQRKEAALDRELKSLDDPKRTEPLTESQRTRRDSLRKDNNETYPQHKLEEQQALEAGEWNELENAAKLAEGKNAIRQYWRELAFFCGAMLLLVGLTIVGFNSQGPERWACLLLLAIIVMTFFGLNFAAAIGAR